MRRWLRANRAGLIALAVVVPLLAALLIPVQLAGRGGPAVEEVPPGGAGRLSGLRYSVVAADEFGRSKGLSTPAGTTLVAAVVEVRPTDAAPEAATCAFALSRPGGTARSTWNPAPPVESATYGYDRGAGFAESCRADARDRYRAELVFLAPAGTAAGAAIDVTAFTTDGTRVLRLRLPAAPAPTAAALAAR